MRTHGQIRHKLKQLIFRHRKKFVEKGLAQRPHNCEHNGVVRLPVHTSNRATIHICQYMGEDKEWNNRVCDSSMGGDEQAKGCPYYAGCHTPESLKADFNKKLGLDGEPVASGALAQEYPDIVALMWVMGTPKKNGAVDVEPEGASILAFFGSDPEEPDTVPDQPLLEETPDE
jgi:hypothetical protein